MDQIGLFDIKERLAQSGKVSDVCDDINSCSSISDSGDESESDASGSDGDSCHTYMLLPEVDSSGMKVYWEKVGWIFTEKQTDNDEDEVLRWIVLSVRYNDEYRSEEDNVDGYFFEYIPADGDRNTSESEFSSCAEILESAVKWSRPTSYFNK